MVCDYICTSCNYSTKDIRNFKRHNKSQRHIKKTELEKKILIKTLKNDKKNNEYICPYCKNVYSTYFGERRHESKCSTKYIAEIIASKDAIINQVKSESKRNIAVIHEKNKRIIQYEKEIELYQKSIVLNNEDKKVSRLKFINKNYKNATQLQTLPYEKFRECRKILYIDNYIDKDEGIIQDVIYSYRHDMLDSYIGDVVLKVYNNVKLEERQIWVTDNSRLKFIVRKKNKNGSYYWYCDNCGDYTSKILISPTIDKIRNLLDKYQKDINSNKYEYEYESYQQEQIMKKNETIIEIILAIDDNKIHKKILKYISPKLLSKDPSIYLKYDNSNNDDNSDNDDN